MNAELCERYLALKREISADKADLEGCQDRLRQLEGSIIEDLMLSGLKSARIATGELFTIADRWSVACREELGCPEAGKLLLERGYPELISVNHQRGASLAGEGVDLSFALVARSYPYLSVRKS